MRYKPIRVEFGACYDHPELGELDVRVTVDVEPVDPGVCYGPPENCYPPSGGGIDQVISVVVDGGEYDGLQLDVRGPHLDDWLDSETVAYAAEEAAADADREAYEEEQERRAELRREDDR